MKRTPLESPTPEIRLEQSHMPLWIGIFFFGCVVAIVVWLMNGAYSDREPKSVPAQQIEASQK